MSESEFPIRLELLFVVLEGDDREAWGKGGAGTREGKGHGR